MTPEEIAALERRLKEQSINCTQCGLTHLRTTVCRPRKAEPPAPVRAPGDSFGLENFKEWERRAKENPTTETPTGRACAFCHKPVMAYKNFLGKEWEEIDGEAPADHAKKHAALMTEPVPELQRPRRTGLPYRDGPDE